MRLAILAALGLSACTPGTAVMTVSEAYRLCQQHGLDVSERFDYLTEIDSPSIVREVCQPDE